MIEIVEVSPRDGLQNEPTIIPTDAKVELITRAVEAGARRIEAVSFVRPDAVPAMADAEAVMKAVPRQAGVRYSGLVLNRRGFQRALDSGVDEVNVVVAASETFNRRNQNASTEQSMRVAEEVADQARAAALPCTVTLATSFGCPFEGEVDRERVVALAVRSAAAGASEVALADTIGVGVPTQVRDLAAAIRAQEGEVALRMHFHNTRNTGYANAVAALDAGITALDASIGGIGGCPFAPNATGNIASEDLVYLVSRMGMDTGLRMDRLISATGFLDEQLERPSPALLARAGPFPS